jgi:hypothetical protein
VGRSTQLRDERRRAEGPIGLRNAYIDIISIVGSIVRERAEALGGPVRVEVEREDTGGVLKDVRIRFIGGCVDAAPEVLWRLPSEVVGLWAAHAIAL